MSSAHDSTLTKWTQALQILAICAAGVWALWIFSVSVLPRLGPNFSGKLLLESEWSAQKETCLFGVTIDITNNSVLKKRITSVDYYGSWEPLPEAPMSGQFTLIEFDPQLSAENELGSHRLRESPLVDIYPPQATSGDGFQIFSEPTPGEALYIYVRIWNGHQEVGYWYDWIEACEPPREKGKHLAESSRRGGPIAKSHEEGLTLVLQDRAGDSKGAYINSAYPKKNWGTSPSLIAAAWTYGGKEGTGRSLIDFDLSQIPNGAELTSARLSLHYDPTSGHEGHSTMSGKNSAYLQRITTLWSVEHVTWDTQPSATTQSQIHLPGSSTRNQNYLDIDVLPLVRDMLEEPRESFGFMLRLKEERHYRSLVFASSNNSNRELHPRLVITYK